MSLIRVHEPEVIPTCPTVANPTGISPWASSGSIEVIISTVTVKTSHSDFASTPTYVRYVQ